MKLENVHFSKVQTRLKHNIHKHVIYVRLYLLRYLWTIVFFFFGAIITNVWCCVSDKKKIQYPHNRNWIYIYVLYTYKVSNNIHFFNIGKIRKNIPRIFFNVITHFYLHCCVLKCGYELVYVVEPPPHQMPCEQTYIEVGNRWVYTTVWMFP